MAPPTGKGRPADPNSLVGRCVAAVLRLGTADVAQVAAEVARHIDPARAVRAARCAHRPRPGRNTIRLDRATKPRLIDVGRLLMIRSALRHAFQRGLIERLSPGRYAAPQPRLYDPGSTRTA